MFVDGEGGLYYKNLYNTFFHLSKAVPSSGCMNACMTGLVKQGGTRRWGNRFGFGIVARL